MKKLYTAFTLFFFQFSFAQNLVPNWSFEDTVACPTYYGQIFKAFGWKVFRETPDYFNACNNTTVGVPLNDAGFQVALSGNAYAGLITFSSFTTNYREIIGCELIQPLIVGQKYFVSLWASRAYNPSSIVYLSSNNIGVRFSIDSSSSISPSTINNNAHLSFSSIITDTLNWTQIVGSFVADSAYRYLSIGNFFEDSNTLINNLDTSIFNQYAYYYIDDIKISTDSAFVNTGVKVYTNNSIKKFPNPARDWIVLEGKGIKSVAILNALGSEIGYYPTTASTLRHQISFGKLSCGVYFLKINMIDERYQFAKIVKE